jgi:hypothetical protein
MGRLYQPELPHGSEHVPPWEIFGKPDEEPAVRIPNPPPNQVRISQRKKQRAPVPSRLLRRISIHRWRNGTACFQLIVSAGAEPLESARFPVEADQRQKREVFDRFVEELRLLGWRKTGAGGTWFDIELTKSSEPKAGVG